MFSILTPEEKLLITLSRTGQSENQRSVAGDLIKEIKDWGHFVKLANDLGVIALCYENLRASGYSQIIPPGYLETLRSAYLKSMSFNTFLYGQLKDIASAAGKENIKIVILKGLALERTVYGNHGLRQISDIDILVETDKALQLRELLIEEGYTSYPLISPLHRAILPYLRSHLPSLQKNGALVEIHVSLFDQEGNSLTEDLFNTSYKIPEDDSDVFYPQHQLHFLYLIKHLDRHEKTKDLQLKSFIDLDILLKKFPDQILNMTLTGIAAEAGLTTALAGKLKLLELFWDLRFPEWIEEFSRIADTGLISERFIHFIRNPGNYSRDRQPDALIKPLRKIPGPINKILFITGYLFPSLKYMKYRYNTGTGAVALFYYPVRWLKTLLLIMAR